MSFIASKAFRYVPILQTTTADLVQSLRMCVCPACNAAKKPAQTFCGHCYRKLPRDMRQSLYQRVGQGYEDAVRAAANHLLDPQSKLAIAQPQRI